MKKRESVDRLEVEVARPPGGQKLWKQFWNVSEGLRKAQPKGWVPAGASFVQVRLVTVGRDQWLAKALLQVICDWTAPKGAGAVASVCAWPLKDTDGVKKRFVASSWYRRLIAGLEKAGYQEQWDPPGRTIVYISRFDESIRSLMREGKRIKGLLDSEVTSKAPRGARRHVSP